MIHQSITKDGIFKFYRPNFKILILLAIFTLSQGNEVILSRSSQSCVSSGRTCEDANSHCCDGLNCYKRSKRDFKRCVPCKDEGKPCGHDLHCCSYKCRNKVCTMKSTNTCNCDSMGTYDTLDYMNIHTAVDQWFEDKSSAEAAYGKIECWNVEKVTTMFELFDVSRTGNANFNENLECWDTSSVRNMTYMFYAAVSFNQNLNAWDVKHVTSMKGMFSYANSFDQDLNAWDVSNVENMDSIFGSAAKFNGDVSNWDVSSVTSMTYMFNFAESFDQSLCWDVSSKEVGQMDDYVEGMFEGSAGCILKDCCPKCEDLLFC